MRKLLTIFLATLCLASTQARAAPFTVQDLLVNGSITFAAPLSGTALGSVCVNGSNQVIIGSTNCFPSGTGTITGPASSAVGYVPLWSNTGGTQIGAGLPVTQAGAASSLVETNASGAIVFSPDGVASIVGNGADGLMLNVGSGQAVNLISTGNTGTVGKLSFLAQDSIGATVDYADLTASVVSNTHGATSGALQTSVPLTIMNGSLTVQQSGSAASAVLTSTLNTGTVGKLSYMGQDSTGATVDYGDLTGSVVSNTHGATVGALDMPVLATGSTTPRSLSTRAADVANALDYGVVCDGSTDTAAALQTFVTGLSTGSYGTSVGYIPPRGRACMLGSKVAIPSNVTLYAAPGSVTFEPTAGNVSNPLLFSFSGGNVLLYGLVFDGNYTANAAYASPLITLFQQSGVTFDHDTFQNANNIGLNLSGGTTSASNITVRDSVFQHVGIRYKATGAQADQHQGIAFSNGTLAQNVGIEIIDNYFTDTGLDAISLGNVTDAVVNGNRCYDVGGNYTTPGLAFGACIYFSSAAPINDATVTGNLTDGAQGSGFEFVGSHLTVTGNTAINSGACGLLFAGTAVTVSGNTSDNNYQGHSIPAMPAQEAGYCLGSAVTSANITFDGNTGTDTQTTKTQQYGFQVLPGASYSGLTIGTNNLQSNGTSPFNNVTSAVGVGAPVITIANLPACTTALQGTPAAVSDASSPTYNGTLTGGGSVVVPVFCNGSSWTAH